MKYYPHPKRSARKDHVPLANKLFLFGLDPAALMIYAYLSYLMLLGVGASGTSCRSISKELGMSENTVRKHLRALSRCRLAQIEGGKCVPLDWLQREGAKNFFPLPMEIFQFHLTPGAFAVYAYLLNREHRKTFDCIVSANKIAKATGMSRNTVRKYVGELEGQMLIETERTSVITKKHLKYNGALRYRILPVQTALDYLHERQLAELDRKRERALARKRLEKQKAPKKKVSSVACHVVREAEELPF